MSLTNEQLQITQAIEYSDGGIYFIHGKGGTGKSYLINTLLKRSVKRIQVLAPTNLAASIYEKGRTINSFFYLEFDDLNNGHQNPNKYDCFRENTWCYKALKTLDTIIIDEISMVRADTLEMINKICQVARHNQKPFGGIQVVLVGDLYQLPPIVATMEEEMYLEHEYGGSWFFESKVIQKAINDVHYYELSRSIRQEGAPDLVEAIDVFRNSSATENQVLDALNYLNNRVISDKPKNAIMVAAKNHIVTRINNENLDKLSGAVYSVKAEIEIRNADLSLDTFTYSEAKVEAHEKFKMPSTYEGEFIFKVGARVMITANDRKQGYKNGDYGTIIEYDYYFKTIIVELEDKPGYTVHIRQSEQYIYDLMYDETKHELKRKLPYYAKVTQYPLRLGYAITAHKSQGQTYNNVYIDLTDDMFTSGQLYVALSRVKTLEGLHLSRELITDDQLIEPKIAGFINVVKK